MCKVFVADVGKERLDDEDFTGFYTQSIDNYRINVAINERDYSLLPDDDGGSAL